MGARRDLQTAEEIIRYLESLANPDNVAGMARYGISSKNTLGVSMPALREIAKGRAKDHSLALTLWESEIREARILAAMVDSPKLVTAEQTRKRCGGSPQARRSTSPSSTCTCPGWTGTELARRIRAQHPKLPLVLFSSLGRREAGDAEGLFSAYLAKPLRQSQLFDTLVGLVAHDEAPKPEAPARPQIDPGMATRHPLRILLAEDNVVNQKLALRLLQQMGYRADLASNGIEAIESVQRQAYDVVLMDVQMPEMDGLEASRQICARFGPDHRPRIVATTATAMAGDREMCLAAGMDDYLTKPIRVERLVEALNDVPAREGRRDE